MGRCWQIADDYRPRNGTARVFVEPEPRPWARSSKVPGTGHLRNSLFGDHQHLDMDLDRNVELGLDLDMICTGIIDFPSKTTSLNKM